METPGMQVSAICLRPKLPEDGNGIHKIASVILTPDFYLEPGIVSPVILTELQVVR